MTTDLERTLAAFLAGERRAAARLITIVEDGGPAADRVLHDLYPRLRGVQRIGITGPPGVGKSTIVEALIRGYRDDGRTVGVVAVDPTSPFSGGALLGDRVRMSAVALDPGVFIRSMATRGSLGGLALATKEVADVLDAFGCDVLLIETVGVGQSEVDVATAADTVVVAVSPESGDAIQTMKAGLMEIADILVVNKADRPGVENTERALRSMLEFSHPADRHHPGDAMPEAAETLPDLYWKPPVLRTVAVESKGIAEVVQALMDHKEYLQHSGEWQRREEARLQNELEALLQNALMASWRAQIADQTYAAALRSLAERQLSPNEAVSRLIAISQERMAADEQQKVLLRRWSPTDVYE